MEQTPVPASPFRRPARRLTRKQKARRDLPDTFDALRRLWQQWEHLQRVRAEHKHDQQIEAVARDDEQAAAFAAFAMGHLGEALTHVAALLDLPAPTPLPLWMGHEQDRPAAFKRPDTEASHDG